MKKLAILFFASFALLGCGNDLAAECVRDDECSADKLCIVGNAVCADPEECLGLCLPDCVTAEDCPGDEGDYDCVGEFGTDRTYCRENPTTH